MEKNIPIGYLHEVMDLENERIRSIYIVDYIISRFARVSLMRNGLAFSINQFMWLGFI